LFAGISRSGVTIVGGLLISQVLTLYTTPIIYLYMERLGRWLSPAKASPAKSTAATVFLGQELTQRIISSLCVLWIGKHMYTAR